MTTPPPVLSFQATPKNKVDVSTHDTSFVCETEHSKSYAFSMSRDGKDCLIRFGKQSNRCQKIKSTGSATIYAVKGRCLKVMVHSICAQTELQLSCTLSLSAESAKFVQVVSHFSTATHHVLEMPLYSETLRQWAESPRKSLHARLEACTGICKCISALGKLQYAHCDVKLDNFVKDSSQKVRLIDFGRALPFKTSVNAKTYDAEYFSKHRPAPCFATEVVTNTTTDVYGVVFSCLHLLLGDPFSNYFNRVKKKSKFLEMKKVWKNFVQSSSLDGLFELYNFEGHRIGVSVADVLHALPRNVYEGVPISSSKTFQPSRRDPFETLAVSGDDDCVVIVPSHFTSIMLRVRKKYICVALCANYFSYLLS